MKHFKQHFSCPKSPQIPAAVTFILILNLFFVSPVNSQDYGSYPADGDEYGSYGPGEPQPATNTIEINSCQILDQSDKTYLLTADLSGAAVTANCMNVAAPNVTLDCQGHSIINHNLQSALVFSNQNGTAIRNCVLESYLGTEYSEYEISLGIQLFASYGLIENNTVRHTGSGIYVVGYNNLVQYNIVENTIKALRLRSNNNIAKNNLTKNNKNAQGWGLEIWNGTGNQFINNKSYGNDYGVLVSYADNTTVRCGHVGNNAVKDIYVYNGSNNVQLMGLENLTQYVSGDSDLTNVPDSCSDVDCAWEGDACVIPGLEAPVLNDAVAMYRKVELSWNAVDHAEGYKIKYGTASGSYETTVDAGNVTHYAVEGLTSNTTYYFVVTAYHQYGESEVSNELNAAPRDATIIPEIISQDTNLILNSSPYRVIKNVVVNAGVTVTIEAGVEIKFAGFYSMDVKGTIDAQGAKATPIIFTSDKPTPAPGDWNSLILRTNNSFLDYVKIEYADRGVYVPTYASNPATIQNSVIQYNNNGVYFEPKTGPYILANTIVNNRNGIYAGCNVFTGCSPSIHGNSIYDNSQYNLYTHSYDSNASGVTINAQRNWWGSADVQAIEDSIYDHADKGILPVVDYGDFLDGPGSDPVTLPPGAPTLNYIGTVNRQVNLGWPDVRRADGYKVKYGTSPGVYDTTLDAGDVVNYSVTGLTQGIKYYFVVIAYNRSGESGVSNELFATPIGSILPKVIEQNTTLTTDNSPYRLVENVVVNAGITLMIEAGVEIRFAGFYSLDSKGTIDARGTEADPVTFTSDKETPGPGDWNSLILRTSSSFLDYVRIEYADRGVHMPTAASNTATIQNSSIQYNNNGIYFEPGTGPHILSNKIIHNGNGIFAGCHYHTICSPTINQNELHDNTSYNLYVYSYNSNASGTTIDAQNNWWGTVDLQEIEASIYHRNDQGILAFVDSIPFLDGPNGNSISIPPGTPALNRAYPGPQKVSLTWTPADDLAGSYKIKYGTAPGDYDTTIDTGNVTAYTVTGLTNETTYYFSITAYNNMGESEASNELYETPTDATLVPPVISQNTTWTLENSPYRIIENVVVNTGVTLTIEPGAVVQFAGYYKLEGNGIIKAQGAEDNLITFTSSKASPAAGDWNYISVRNSASVFDYVKVEYGQRGIYVVHPVSAPVIQNSLFQNNVNGIYFELNTNPQIFHNTIINNSDGVHASCNKWTGCRATLHNNRIYDNKNANFYAETGGDSSYDWIDAQNNWWGTSDPQGIMTGIHDFMDDNTIAAVDFTPFLDGPEGNSDHSWDNRLYGNVGDRTLTIDQGPYVAIQNMMIPANKTLTIDPGVELRFDGNYALRIRSAGKLIAQGTEADRIVFTSNKSSPVPGDWEGLVFEGGAWISVLEYTHIAYAQRGFYEDHMTDVVLAHNLIENNVNGIWLFRGTPNSSITNNAIINNIENGIVLQYHYEGLPQPVMNYNTIHSNGLYNITIMPGGVGKDYSATIINAENNWWGTAEAEEISAGIYDHYDRGSHPRIDFYPFMCAEPGNEFSVSDVSVTNRFFNIGRGESAQINYTIGIDAGMTINIYDYPAENLVRTLLDHQPRTAGSYSESWDGRDDTAQILPAGIYTYTVEAENAEGDRCPYAPIEFDETLPVLSNVVITPETLFSPFKGERLEVGYDLDMPALVSLRASKSSHGYNYKDFLVKAPHEATRNTDFWDGRDSLGNIVVLQPPGKVYIEAKTERLPENLIVAVDKSLLDITILTSEPYVIRPIYSEVTEITYSITENATVTAQILSLDGNAVIKTIEESITKAAGTYTLMWDGRDEAGETITDEGDYRIHVEAVDSHGHTVKRDGNIRILY